jgi:hydroxyethylthiazole kinase-like sugar kinase family protein
MRIQLLDKLFNAFVALKGKRPLIHHITNLMTMNDVATVTKMLGATPFLAHAPNEVFSSPNIAFHYSHYIINLFVVAVVNLIVVVIHFRLRFNY